MVYAVSCAGPRKSVVTPQVAAHLGRLPADAIPLRCVVLVDPYPKAVSSPFPVRSQPFDLVRLCGRNHSSFNL